MVDITKVNKISFKIDEKAKLRAAIGLNIGMCLGIGASFVALCFADMQTWYRVFALIGTGCGFFLLLGGAINTVMQYKAYMNSMKEFEKLNAGAGPIGPTPYVG